MVSILLHFRKREPQFNSVEELFDSVLLSMPSGIDINRMESPTSGASLRSLWSNCRAAGRCRADLHHVTGHINYIVPALRGRTVLTVHDVGSALTGRVLRKLLVKLIWFWLPALRATCITTISDFTRADVTRLVPYAGKRIRTVHDPVNPKLTYKTKAFSPNHPRILHIGTKANKNLKRTAQALKGLPCTLVVIGRLTDRQTQFLGDYGLEVENRCHLSYGEIVLEYVRCDLVSFASTYEGFGMPIIEANAVGRPVIAGNVTAMPEAAGDAACLVDPYNVESIRNGIRRVIEDASYRDQLVHNGLNNIKRFAPEKIAMQYVRVYEEALGRPLLSKS